MNVNLRISLEQQQKNVEALRKDVAKVEALGASREVVLSMRKSYDKSLRALLTRIRLRGVKDV